MQECLIKSQTERKVVTDWTVLKVGERLIMVCEEFDGYSETPCTVTEVHKDHVIAMENCESGVSLHPQTLWIDKFNQDMFVYSKQ